MANAFTHTKSILLLQLILLIKYKWASKYYMFNFFLKKKKNDKSYENTS